jgi:hypothetical protein
VIDLVLDGHGFGVCGFLAGYAFWSGEDAAVVVLFALNPTSRTGREKWGTRFCLGLDQSLVLCNEYRDPSLGVARLRARLRRLRMTISKRRLCRSPDSVTQNDFLGEDCGALHLGEGELYAGVFGESREI